MPICEETGNLLLRIDTIALITEYRRVAYYRSTRTIVARGEHQVVIGCRNQPCFVAAMCYK